MNMHKRFSAAAFAVVFALASINGLTSAQTSRRASARAIRRVRGNVLISNSLPPIRIKFNNVFLYVGSQKFIQNNRTSVQQFFFVDADANRNIRRMYMAQFAGYLPNVNAAYNYTTRRTMEIGGDTYSVNSGIAPKVSAILQRNPRSDVARGAAFLASRGYHISESVMYERMARVVDDARRNEFILLYVEDLSQAGLTANDFAAGGRAAVERERILQNLSERAMRNFTVLK
jgi:hypothetical protein